MTKHNHDSKRKKKLTQAAQPPERNLIHRDIKPANIMLVEQGVRPDVAKVLDFGIVKELKPVGGALLTQADSITGTPMYLSPEMLKAPDSIDARSDICRSHYTRAKTWGIGPTRRPTLGGSGTGQRSSPTASVSPNPVQG